MRASAVPTLLGAALLAAATGLSFPLAQSRLMKPYDVQHVPSGSSARLAALGHRTLVSDLYWLSAVQYIGDRNADARGWGKLLPLIELVTDLDPRHGYAYQTAGIVLSAAGLLDESDTILKKGVERGPAYWTFPYYLAFNDWFYRGDYASAARWAELAARRPGASPNISQLAVSLASKGGTPEQAIALLVELRRTVRDEQTKARLDEQLKLAILERDAQILERAVAEFERRRGVPVTTLDDVLTARILSAIPVDPFGGRYELDGGDHRIHSTANPFRFSRDEARHAPQFHYQPKASNLERTLR